MDEKLTHKIHNLMQEVYAAGIAEGRSLARADLGDQIITMLSAPKKNGHTTRAPRQRRRQAMPPIPPPPEIMPLQPAPVERTIEQAIIPSGEKHPPEPPAPEPVAGDLLTRVSGALSRMPMTQEGVDPDALTQFINIHTVTNGDSDPITVRDVRGALRQMTMSGEARRIARGRYVAGNPPAGPLNF